MERTRRPKEGDEKTGRRGDGETRGTKRRENRDEKTKRRDDDKTGRWGTKENEETRRRGAKKDENKAKEIKYERANRPQRPIQQRTQH